MNDEELKLTSELWDAFLEFTNAQPDNVSVPHFVTCISLFISKMAFDCAPSEEIARKTLEASIHEGRAWSLREKNE